MNVILSFRTTRHAIAGERLLLDAGENVRVMPLPERIAAGCGICLRVALARRERAIAILEEGGVRIQGSHLRVDAEYWEFPAPVFSRALRIEQGDVVALVGCGGKTALANRVATENRHLPVLLSTTTRIIEPPDSIVDRRVHDAEALNPGVNLAYGQQRGGKLCGIEAECLQRLCPFDGVTILEADGSRGLPLKGWAEYEPVVPTFTTTTVGVCSVRPVGSLFSPADAHRPEIFQEITGIRTGERVGIDHLAAMIEEMFRKAVGRRVLCVNQIETPEQERAARLLAERLSGMRVVAGSVRDGNAVVLEDGL